jgi:type IV fimbrial biogenesis protein FimT
MTTCIRRHRPGKDPSGFTIVELMVTVCLVAILLAVGVPSFRQMIAINRLTTQTNDLISAINTARSDAITRNTTVRFCRTAAEADNACVTSTGNWGSWIVLNAANEVIRRGAVPTYGAGIKVTSTFGSDTMNFRSDGLGRNGISATLINAEVIRVCTSTTSQENIRTITPGSGSRLSTTRSTGPC